MGGGRAEMDNIPMIAGRKSSLPTIYGDTPSFLGCPIARLKKDLNKYDVVIGGVPWEGTITWGTYSGCELAPKTIRHAAARYGGFLPEYDINLFDHLNVGDYGDVIVDPCDPQTTMKRVRQRAKDIYEGHAIPFFIGGDHSFTPEVVAALAGRYHMLIVTNGLQEVQKHRLAQSAIRHYFPEMIISEEVGASKPDPAVFDAVFARMGNPPKDQVLLIGDGLSSDIQGGNNYGIDVCWFNRYGHPADPKYKIQYEINRLTQLLAILE